jgi:hypothetical protein
MRAVHAPSHLLVLLFLAGCAGFAPPLTHEEVGFKQRSVARSQDDLSIAAVALSAEEARGVDRLTQRTAYRPEPHDGSRRSKG